MHTHRLFKMSAEDRHKPTLVFARDLCSFLPLDSVTSTFMSCLASVASVAMVAAHRRWMRSARMLGSWTPGDSVSSLIEGRHNDVHMCEIRQAREHREREFHTMEHLSL